MEINLPPVCSSSYPPAQCHGKRAADPCIARIGVYGAPTGREEKLSPQQEFPAKK